MSENEELAALIEATADSHNGLWPGPLVGKLYRAAALLRQLAPAPAPAADGERDHVPGAGNMVAADEEREEREELARWLEFEADNAQELGCATIYDHDRLRWAAGYLRQLPPEGLVAVEYFHIASSARIVGEASEKWGECWNVYNSRHVSPCTEFRTVADAAAALRQPPKGGEVEP